MIELRDAIMQRHIIDNYDQNSLAAFLGEAIKFNKDSLFIATGFFNVGGYALLRGELEKMTLNDSCQFKLIIGREIIDEPKNLSYESLRDELENAAYDEGIKNNVDGLIKFLRQKNVMVRSNEDKFTHAKCYIFDNCAVVGSSNFTNRGLQKGTELNAVLKQTEHLDEIKLWFERTWTKGDDIKTKLIDELDASKFGSPIDPHMMWMKILYEYYKQRLEDIRSVDISDNELTNFQKHAVVSAVRILREHKGVIIADSTGLGKTRVGIELLRKKAGIDRKKTLLIAPKQVLESVWKPELDNEWMNVKKLSIEKTGHKSFEPGGYIENDVVVIDESHNYRSGYGSRYKNLMKILASGTQKEVILLTATPINNSLMDLYYQLNLLTGGDDTYFANLDIPNLYQHFRSVDKKTVLEGADSVNSILYAVMIKRTRQHIRDNYPNDTININSVETKLTFPTRKLQKIEYSLTKVFGTTVYKKVLDLIDEVNLVPYKVEAYNLKSDDEDKQIAIHRSSLHKTFLMKRFESSVEAIRNSIQTLENFYKFFKVSLDDDKILDSRTFHKILAELASEDEYEEDELLEVIKKQKLVSLSGYDKKAIRDDVNRDLEKIQSVLSELNGIRTYADTKLTALKENFGKNDVFGTGSRKVVIFTSYVDTANYIVRDLRSNLSEEVFLMTGKTDDRERDRILKKFSPKSNNGEITNSDCGQVLVSTDVLSEGQNLQDCNYIINYDLPWNPMKIVQRVGRVDRLTSEFDTITSAVFIPEKELDSMLKLLERLEQKISKIGETVGVEATIFGERENPKDFNAIDKIKKEDSGLIEEMERGMDMITSDSPFDLLLKFRNKFGNEKLESIPFGRRSALKSPHSGLVLFYRNVEATEHGTETKSTHAIFYNYFTLKFEHIDDVGWTFSKIKCDSNEPLDMPFTEKDSFKEIAFLDKLAREKIVSNFNKTRDAKNSQDIGSKKQQKCKEIIETSHRKGIVDKDDIGDAHKILSRKNLSPWNAELEEYIEHYESKKDVFAFIKNIQSLIGEYKLNLSDERTQKNTKSDLRLVGCVFLNGKKMIQRRLM